MPGRKGGDDDESEDERREWLFTFSWHASFSAAYGACFRVLSAMCSLYMRVCVTVLWVQPRVHILVAPSGLGFILALERDCST